MKKWVVPLLSVLLVFVLVYLSGPFHLFKFTASKGDRRGEVRPEWTQNPETEKEEGETAEIQLLKKVEEQLDEWLKSINEQIEKEDVSRLKVRFLEVLRNVLEWVREKVDKRIESQKGKIPRKKGGVRET